MADRTMKELLQAPTEGYGEAIVIPEILAENFEIKTNLLQDVSNDAIKLMLFPYSLEGAARVWYEKEPPNSILTWDDLVNKFVNQFFPPSKTTHLKNEISCFTQIFEETFREAWDRFKEMIRACPHHGFLELTQIDTFYNGLTEQDQDSLNAAAGGSLLNKTTREALKIIENKSKVRYSRSKSNVSRVNTNSRDIVSKTDDRIDKLADHISNLVEIVNKHEENLRRNLNNDMRSILGSFFRNQPSTSSTLLSNTVPNPKGEMKAVTTRSGLAYEGPSIPTESPLEKVDEQNSEEILDKEHSNCSGSTAQVQPLVVPISIPEPDSLLANNDKLFKLAKVSLNENCSAMLLKKLPEKLGDLGKFLIPCDFPRMEVCHALADLGVSINLMPLSIWKKLSLPELTPTRMPLELADRSITRPKGVAEDVFIKVGKFHFLTDFVVVDFEADPIVPLILGRSFLRTGRALIDVYGEEITLRVNEESITFNLNQTMRYSLTYDDTSVNRVDLIDIACEDFVQDVLDFQYNPKSSSPTLLSDYLISENDSSKEPIVKSSLPTLTPFGETKESKEKSFVEEPPKLELKKLPSHLEYAFLEDSNKLPVIIAKNLKVDEREALINVFKSHKRAISWKISDIKGIDPRFCTNKILMEDDNKPAVQSQRRVSPIHCVPKKRGMTVVTNKNNELIPTRFVTGWRVCIDYKKLNDANRKDHFPLPFMDQMLERLAGNEFYCFLDGFQGISKFLLIHKTRKKLLSHALMEPSRTDACPLACVMPQDFSKIARPMTHLLENETPFVFSKECIDAFNTLKKKLTESPILVVPDWNLPFELMCDANDYAIGAVLGQCKSKHFQPIHYASKMMTEAQIHYTTTEKEMLAIEAFEILKACPEGPSGGHHGANLTAKKAYENSVIYKERTKKLHDSKIKNHIFNVGDQVLLFNSRIKIFSGKLRTRWSGPFTITRVFPYGIIKLSQPNSLNFKVNGHRVKHYFGGDIPFNVALDLYTFPMDN
uniref:DNA-directed DNA polymerase n=1 Tax=Tanacetum cinerariifolium TaxID=118510 RepID=A0A6L2KBC0_TANCI|nr:DNA-directed DNA polymerase [Tanacetum cinerariifolium]